MQFARDQLELDFCSCVFCQGQCCGSSCPLQFLEVEPIKILGFICFCLLDPKSADNDNGQLVTVRTLPSPYVMCMVTFTS